MPLSQHHRPLPSLLSGVEACARGALEAGVRLVTGYPGTPATPAVEYLMAAAGDETRVEWAVNEKVALEIAAGHSWSGQRSFVAMKMSGLNVASDALLSIVASGTRGGLVVYVGDDPGMYYGMVEQDSRLLARLAACPMVEPGTPDEGREMVRHAFEVSEAEEVPVLVRGTTTTANTVARVRPGPTHREQRRSDFPWDVDRYTKAGAGRCLRQHADALARLSRAAERLDRWNRLEPSDSRLGVVATASVWGYVEEALEAAFPAGLRPNLLRLGVVHPVPERRLREFLERCDRVLVVEELEPVVEEKARAVAGSLAHRTSVLGKDDGLGSPVGDLDPDRVRAFLAVLAQEPATQEPATQEPATQEPATQEPATQEPATQEPATQEPATRWAPRLLTFCPGCPHRSTYVALERAIHRAGMDKDEVVVTGDVGCTILGMNPPHGLCRTEVAMGSSIAVAQGIAYADAGRPVVATIGDSTFFHAGIPPLLNAAAQGVDLTVIVLDNGYASMTGYQPSLGSSGTRETAPPVPMSIEELARAARVRRVRKAFPYFTSRLSRVLAQALTSPGVHVVIAEAPCVGRLVRRTVIPYRVLPDRCPGVGPCPAPCMEAVGCPALDVDEPTSKAVVDPARCLGCGLCASACPAGAIRRHLRGRRRT